MFYNFIASRAIRNSNDMHKSLLISNVGNWWFQSEFYRILLCRINEAPCMPHSCTRLFSCSRSPPKSILAPTFSAKPTRSCLVRPIARAKRTANLFSTSASTRRGEGGDGGCITDGRRDTTLGPVYSLPLAYVFPPFAHSRRCPHHRGTEVSLTGGGTT